MALSCGSRITACVGPLSEQATGAQRFRTRSGMSAGDGRNSGTSAPRDGPPPSESLTSFFSDGVMISDRSALASNAVAPNHDLREVP
jgi:hypothetical protein